MNISKRLLGMTLIISVSSQSFAADISVGTQRALDQLATIIAQPINKNMSMQDVSRMGGDANYQLFLKVMQTEGFKATNKNQLEGMMNQFEISNTYTEQVPTIKTTSAIDYLISSIAYKTWKYARNLEAQRMGGEENYKIFLSVIHSKGFQEMNKMQLEGMLKQFGEGETTSSSTESYWTEWMNRDDASGNGDFETYAEFVKDGRQVCKAGYKAIKSDYQPKNTLNYVQMVYEVDNTYHQSKQDYLGLVCRNKWNTPERPCVDYKVQFFCEKE